MMSRAILASVLVLSGCTSSPPRAPLEAEFDVPKQWQAVKTAVGRTPPQWWLEFGDDALDQIVREALTNNYDLVRAAARVEQARARARIAGADLYPTLDAVGGASRTKRNFIGFTFIPDDPDASGSRVLSSTTNQFNWGLDLSWELDVWGRIRAGKSAAVADAEAALIDREAAALSLAGRVAKAWFSAIEAREQRELAQATVDTYTQSAGSVRSRYERGVVPALDLRLALTELEGAQALVSRRSQELDAAIRDLEVLLGRYPERALQPETELPAPLGRVPAGLPTDLLSRRPDLVVAERTLAAAGARVDEARAALFPRIALTGSSGRASEEIEDLLDNAFSVWGIAGNLAQPVFQGGALRAAVDLANAEQVDAAAAYAGVALQSYKEVETLLAAESLLAEREQHLAVAAEQSRAALALATQRYTSGLEEYVTLLASQRNLLTAESEHIVVRRARLEARVDLYLALGGGFDASAWLERYALGTPAAAGVTANVPVTGGSS